MYCPNYGDYGVCVFVKKKRKENKLKKKNVSKSSLKGRRKVQLIPNVCPPSVQNKENKYVPTSYKACKVLHVTCSFFVNKSDQIALRTHSPPLNVAIFCSLASDEVLSERLCYYKSITQSSILASNSTECSTGQRGWILMHHSEYMMYKKREQCQNRMDILSVNFPHLLPFICL